MRKKFTIFLILIFVLGLTPVNFSNAITQNQIDAEVQIICPDNQGNIYAGSGTIISKTGAILTNKHVVTDLNGETIQFCWVGLGNKIETTADFNNDFIAETKYVSSDDNLDLAILFIINNEATEFDYINIQESTSNFLTAESNIDALGYPAYNDFKLTKTTGNFLSYLPFNNYFEATTYI